MGFRKIILSIFLLSSQAFALVDEPDDFSQGPQDPTSICKNVIKENDWWDKLTEKYCESSLLLVYLLVTKQNLPEQFQVTDEEFNMFYPRGDVREKEFKMPVQFNGKSYTFYGAYSKQQNTYQIKFLDTYKRQYVLDFFEVSDDNPIVRNIYSSEAVEMVKEFLMQLKAFWREEVCEVKLKKPKKDF